MATKAILVLLALVSGGVLSFLQRRRCERLKLVEDLRHSYEIVLAQYVNVLHEKVGILDQYVGDYFNTMSESEFSKLKQIDEALQKLSNECYEYLLAENPVPVAHLIGFLQGEPMIVTTRIQELTSVNLHLINEWRRKAHDHLISTVLVLKRTSTHNQAAAIHRNRNRMETEEMLNEIIKWSFPESAQ